MGKGHYNDDVWMGQIAEVFVEYELLKRQIYCQKMPPTWDFDYYASNGLRIEVKSGRPVTSHKTVKGKTYSFSRWQFRNSAGFRKRNIGRNRDCDFYVLVCMDADRNPLSVYIVPNSVVGNRLQIHVGASSKEFCVYKNNWDLIIKHSCANTTEEK